MQTCGIAIAIVSKRVANLSVICNKLARLYRQEQQWDSAREFLLRAMDIRQELVTGDKGNWASAPRSVFES